MSLVAARRKRCARPGNPPRQALRVRGLYHVSPVIPYREKAARPRPGCSHRPAHPRDRSRPFEDVTAFPERCVVFATPD
jgi:hypothetical protein